MLISSLKYWYKIRISYLKISSLRGLMIYFKNKVVVITGGNIIIAMLFIFIFLPAYAAQSQHIENKLIGTWKLVSITNENLLTGKKADDYGPNPIGYLNYSLNGRMMVIITKKDRKKPVSKITTPDEALRLLNTMTSYAGTYTVNKNQIVHHIDVAWNPSWIGTNQVRFYKLEGKRLTLTMAPFIDPVLGKITIHLVWEKIN